MAGPAESTDDLDVLSLEELLSDSTRTQEAAALPAHFEPVLAADTVGMTLAVVLCALVARQRTHLTSGERCFLGMSASIAALMACAVVCDIQLILHHQVIWALRLTFAFSAVGVYLMAHFSWVVGTSAGSRRWLLCLLAVPAALAFALALSNESLRAVIIERGLFIRVYGHHYEFYTALVAGALLVTLGRYLYVLWRGAPIGRRATLGLLLGNVGVAVFSVVASMILPRIELGEYMFYASLGPPLSLVVPFVWLRAART